MIQSASTMPETIPFIPAPGFYQRLSALEPSVREEIGNFLGELGEWVQREKNDRDFLPEAAGCYIQRIPPLRTCDHPHWGDWRFTWVFVQRVDGGLKVLFDLQHVRVRIVQLGPNLATRSF